MSKRIEIIDTIDSSTTADIGVKKKMDYGVTRDPDAYEDTEVPDMGAVRAVVGEAIISPPITLDIIGGVTTIPQTIAHPGLTWPTVMFRDSAGNKYGGALDQDDGTSIIVTGDDTGDGTFADSFTVIIKP